MTTRLEFQSLAESLLADAQALYRAGRWHGSYHLAGLALEMALKAAVCAHLGTDPYPADPVFKNHRLPLLALLAGLNPVLDADIDLKANWSAATDWKIDDRYRWPLPQAEAQAMLEAMTKPVKGLMPWLRTRW